MTHQSRKENGSYHFVDFPRESAKGPAHCAHVVRHELDEYNGARDIGAGERDMLEHFSEENIPTRVLVNDVEILPQTLQTRLGEKFLLSLQTKFNMLEKVTSSFVS